jgi:hypothetical protein
MALQLFRAWLARLAGSAEEQAAPMELEPQELVRVRLTAELAADWLCDGLIACVANPWRRGTRQWILWETSYQAQLLQHEFANTSPAMLPPQDQVPWETVALAA